MLLIVQMPVHNLEDGRLNLRIGLRAHSVNVIYTIWLSESTHQIIGNFQTVLEDLF